MDEDYVRESERMTISEVTRNKRDLEAFDVVVALYSILKANPSSLRTKQVIYRAGEMDESDPMGFALDFVMDVELKSKRLLGEPIYNAFLRTVFNEQLEVLPEYTREALGQHWLSYGLGPEGTYRKLYFLVKNEQMRSYMKGKNGRADDVHFTAEPAGIEPTTFD